MPQAYRYIHCPATVCRLALDLPLLLFIFPRSYPNQPPPIYCSARPPSRPPSGNGTEKKNAVFHTSLVVLSAHAGGSTACEVRPSDAVHGTSAAVHPSRGQSRGHCDEREFLGRGNILARFRQGGYDIVSPPSKVLVASVYTSIYRTAAVCLLLVVMRYGGKLIAALLWRGLRPYTHAHTTVCIVKLKDHTF